MSLDIYNNNSLLRNSCSVDLEWIPYSGIYSHDKTRLVAAAFCTHLGTKLILHISNFEKHPNPEKQLILAILRYLDRFSLTFGWYTTGLAKYDTRTGEYIGGRDSDFFILDKRCQYHNIRSPVNYSQSGSSTFLYGRKHLDLHKIYSKEIIQKGVFNDKYRTLHLEEVSQALLGIGKYSDSNNNSISGDRSHLLSVQRLSYVGRDSELTMMLACYNDCLVLRIMEFIAMYSEMDYVITCHTGVTKWYTNIYNKMIERDECTLQTSEHKIPKQDYGGGNSIEPIKGFYKNEPIDELDVKGMYPTIAIKYNVSFETVNCRCCKGNPMAGIPPEIMNEINTRLQEKALPRRTEDYWICKLRTGAFPKVLIKLLKEREKHQSLLKQELVKPKQQQKQELINYYEARQVAAKLLANAGYGVFARKEFEYSDYRVSEIITGFGRLTHKKMQELGFNYGFQTVFGFTDSIFVRHNNTKDASNLTLEAGSKTEKNINQYLDDCHNELGVRVDHKNRFMFTIIFDKKNRYIAWTGNYADRPVLKNLDGMSRKYPKWIKMHIEKIAIHLITRPDASVTPIIQKVIEDLEYGRFEPTDMQFTEQLDKDPNQYPNAKGAYSLYPIFVRNYLKTSVTEKAVYEFEYIKKILLVEVPVLLFTVVVGHSFTCVSASWLCFYTLYLKYVLSASLIIPIETAMLIAVPGGLFRIIFQMVRKEFRFYFAKGCFRIMTQTEEELEKMHYLKLGLESYNKFLRRHLKYQISESNIKKFYFKYIREAIQERNEMINSLLQAFEDGRTKPVVCISAIMKVPETEEFLTQESFGQKLKAVGTFLAATIPILISVIEVIRGR